MLFFDIIPVDHLMQR